MNIRVFRRVFQNVMIFNPLTVRNGLLRARLPPSTSRTGVGIDSFFGPQMAQRIKNIILKNVLQ